MNDKVKVKHKGGAGGVVHEFGWNFEASDTIEVDPTAAKTAVEKYPDVFEIVQPEAPARSDRASAKE